jgi:hypothetical protein
MWSRRNLMKQGESRRRKALTEEVYVRNQRQKLTTTTNTNNHTERVHNEQVEQVVVYLIRKQPREILEEEMLYLTFREIVAMCSSHKELNYTFCQFDSGEFKKTKKNKKNQKRAFWKRYFRARPHQFEPVMHALLNGRSVPEHFVKFCLEHKCFSRKNRAKLLQSTVFDRHPEWLQRHLLKLPENKYRPNGDFSKNKYVSNLVSIHRVRLFDRHLEWVQKYLLKLPKENFPHKRQWFRTFLENYRFHDFPKWLQDHILYLPVENFTSSASGCGVSKGVFLVFLLDQHIRRRDIPDEFLDTSVDICKYISLQ